MTLERFHNSAKVYSDNTISNQLHGTQRKKPQGIIAVTDRTIPYRKWITNQGASNFETDRVNSIYTDAFGLNHSHNVFRFTDSLPFRPKPRPIKIWDIEADKDKTLDAPNIVDDFFCKPISTSPDQQSYVIALGKSLYFFRESHSKLFDSQKDLKIVNYNDEGTKACSLEYNSHSVSNIDVTQPSSNPKSTVYKVSTAVVSTFSLQGRAIYAGTKEGDILQGDVRERSLKRIYSTNEGEIINISISKNQEYLAAVSTKSFLELSDLRYLVKPIRKFFLDSPKCVEFHPYLPQIMVGSGHSDTRLGLVDYNFETTLEMAPYIEFGRKICSVRWIDWKTCYVGLGSANRAKTAVKSILSVVKVVNDELKVVAQNASFGEGSVKALQVEKFGDRLLALVSDETLRSFPIDKILRKEQKPIKSTLTSPELR